MSNTPEPCLSIPALRRNHCLLQHFPKQANILSVINYIMMNISQLLKTLHHNTRSSSENCHHCWNSSRFRREVGEKQQSAIQQSSCRKRAQTLLGRGSSPLTFCSSSTQSHDQYMQKLLQSTVDSIRPTLLFISSPLGMWG